jgi:serine/threonine-protein kinase
MSPVWVDDGTRIAFSSGKGGAVDLFWVVPDGAAEPQPLFANEREKYAASWSPSQGLLAFVENGSGTREDVWLLNLAHRGKPEVFLRTHFSESSPAFSPDGRWLAYESDESGQLEIYARPARGPQRKWQISTDGGRHPRWSPAGDRLLYVNGDRLMAVAVSTDRDFSATRPAVVVDYGSIGPPGGGRGEYYGGVLPNYDVSHDGRRILTLLLVAPPPARRFIVVQDWLDELKRRMPSR